MSHRPTIDTLAAKRALEEAGLDPEIAEVLVGLIDTGIHNSTIDRVELEILRKDIIKGRIREWSAVGVLVTILGGLIALARFGVSIFGFSLPGF